MPTEIQSLRSLGGTTADNSDRFAIFPPVGESDQQSLDELREAIVISLHTDRRADPSDLPDGIRNRGWWGSSVDDEADPIGSLLWAVQARGLTQGAAPAYEQAARDALSWLVEDGVAARVDVSAERIAGGVALSVTVHRSAGDKAPKSYSYVWEDYLGG